LHFLQAPRGNTLKRASFGKRKKFAAYDELEVLFKQYTQDWMGQYFSRSTVVSGNFFRWMNQKKHPVPGRSRTKGGHF
jgi:hypothetical protein